jgi:alcohol dehydrogenase, propanol-preferring
MRSARADNNKQEYRGNQKMKAMLLKQITNLEENPTPLDLVDRPIPEPKKGEMLVQVSVCGVCHTELDEIEGRTPPPHLPVILGHQVVGVVVENKGEEGLFKPGDRVGIAWIYSACGKCEFCRQGFENLCPDFQATGRDADGGYAEYMVVPENFAHPIPKELTDSQAAPLLCAGAIGYRSLRLTELRNGGILGLTGFGASGHLVLKMAHFLYPDSGVVVFARNPEQREFALELGAIWAGEIGEAPPQPVDALIDTTPVWKPIVEGLAVLKPGGRLVVNAIRKLDSDQNYLLELDYAQHLWMEKEIKSVANVTRRDVGEFLDLAARMGIQPQVEEYPLEEANLALNDLKRGGGKGALVLRISTA